MFMQIQYANVTAYVKIDCCYQELITQDIRYNYLYKT